MAGAGTAVEDDYRGSAAGEVTDYFVPGEAVRVDGGDIEGDGAFFGGEIDHGQELSVVQRGADVSKKNKAQTGTSR